MQILKTKGLCKFYEGGESIVHAVQDITTSFEAGEFCAVTGPAALGNPHYCMYWAGSNIRRRARFSIRTKIFINTMMINCRF